ncbi:MAG TPA: BamA/TamA family outer membrane protein [bacterium]|nr:BamA/TamA family outer membrane protein [bacterium]
MRRWISIFLRGLTFLLVAVTVSSPPAHAWREAPRTPKNQPPSVEVCPGRVTVVGAKLFKLTKVERSFVCGDSGSDSWKRVPMSQAKYHLRTFLQERGRYQPEFSEDGDRLIVRLGPLTRVRSWTVNGAPKDADVQDRRRVKGRILTPKLLNEIEQWLVRRLKSRGYPCPDAKSKADPVTGDVVVEVTPGPQQNVIAVTEEPVLRMNPGVPRRFDAFKVGKPFNDDLLSLSADRIETDGLLQSTYFKTTCEPEGAVLEQKTFAGRPRIVSVGFGANTEGVVLVKGSWKHTRLEDNASLFEAEGFASYKRQKLAVSSRLYPFKPTSRWHLLPIGEIDHQRESEFHFLSGDVQINAAGGWDDQKIGFKFSFGPDLNYVETYRGAQPGLTRFLTLRSRIELMSHYFEYYLTRPRTGYRASFTVNFGNSNLLSEVTAQRFLLDGEYLYNFRHYEPPLLVFGVRGGLYGTFARGDAATLAKLPPNYRFYLGGSPDLRGWGRRELPSEDGALSAAFLSFEIRLAELLPGGFQPFGFFDAGIFGSKALRFDAPVYYSPGGGLRWESPVGMIRGTVGHGFKAGGNQAGTKDGHWQFYVSFGEEF